MKVKFIYRNYKPLHMVYQSLIENPPAGVEYIAPSVKNRLRKLHGYYKTLRFFPPTRYLIKVTEQAIFTNRKSNDDADLYHFINMISEEPPSKPFIVDTEHAAGLISFTPDPKRVKKVSAFMQNINCRGVSCWSQAAQRTLSELLGSDYDKIADKVEVIYPALPKLTTDYKPDYSLVPKSNKLKVLFVGNQAYLKGLDELLSAAQKINHKYSADKIEWHIVTDDGAPIVKKYNLKNARLYPPQFSKKDIINKLYLPSDIFIMPTKEDTFGLAILDAQLCGKPVITTSQFATPELVHDGVDGLLLTLDNAVLDRTLVPNKRDMDSVTKQNFDSQLEDQIVKTLSKILDGQVNLIKMGQKAKHKFEAGQPFSIIKRNKAINQLYKRALQ
jgi:glycosyltransferase involved in cell wall biosynthesis